MDTEEVVVLPWIHKVFIDEGAWSDNARHLSRVLRLALCFRRCIVKKLVTYRNVLIEVLNEDLKVTIQLISREAGLKSLALYIARRCFDLLYHRKGGLLAASSHLPLGLFEIQ